MNILLFIHLAVRIALCGRAGLLLRRVRTPSGVVLLVFGVLIAIHAGVRLAAGVHDPGAWRFSSRETREIGEIGLDVALSAMFGLATVLAGQVQRAAHSRIRAMQILAERAVDEERASSCRRLAEGMGHRVGTMLTALRGAMELLNDDLREVASVQPRLAQLEQALRNAERVGDDLQLMGGSQTFEPRRLDVSDIIGAVAEQLTRTLGDDHVVRVHIDCREAVVVDARRFTRGIWRLLSNAVAAIQDNGGTIELSVTAMDVGPSDATPLPSGRWVCVDVHDTGVGMSKLMCRRALEPFYSTKGGRGLGLPVVQAFASQSGGYFELHSRLGAGTSARLLLPAARSVDAQPAAGQPATGQPVHPPSGPKVGPSLALERARPRVLLVEDTEPVRLIVEEMLNRIGCDVCVAVDGEEALEIAEAERFAFDLVLSDVEMPRLGGIDLQLLVRKRAPHLRFVLMTAHPKESFVPGFLPDQVPVLHKPFGLSDLSATVTALGLQPAATPATTEHPAMDRHPAKPPVIQA